ncbi:tRNA lysidine(34) synthetase TilS [Acidimangrovimonas sediminis]|uniref:tRNA lysidine(34) synthetase TilS n=1 Tax=Acidimangrovimonas sediminis TaxID=2056283 RepID=UPI001E4BC5A1|nr:tRNA lysidine(34) synthetase TilS [Acidimangrovimonas sediminis]
MTDGAAAPGVALASAMAEAFDRAPACLGVAVSGGGDSLALLHLLHDWAASHGTALTVATVDHGLRPEAAEEAAMVARVCAGLGIPHQTLRWRDWDGRGNLSDAARRGRYALLAGWALGQGAAAVALGHTLDDQAETVLMRLARGSGVDGLSAMAPVRRSGRMLWLRPLLRVTRARLRAVLEARGLKWAEDPTNDDPAYDRVRARQALALLAPLGVDARGLAATAGRMAMARAALEAAALRLAEDAVQIEAGDVVIDRAALVQAPEETRLRLVAHALGWISSADYRPRLTALTEALGAALQGRKATLSGCLMLPRGETLRLTREAHAVAGLTAPPGAAWDGRWRLEGSADKDMHLAALGEGGLALCPRWRETGLPRDSLIAAPALWRGTTLIAAPLAGPGAPGDHGDWRLVPEKGREDFLATLLSH